MKCVQFLLIHFISDQTWKHLVLSHSGQWYKNQYSQEKLTFATFPSTPDLIQLQSVFGHVIVAHVIDMPCAILLPDNTVTENIIISIAVTDDLKSDVLLCTQDYNDIIHNAESVIPQVVKLNGSDFLALPCISNLNCTRDNNLSDVSSTLELKIINSTNSKDVINVD